MPENPINQETNSEEKPPFDRPQHSTESKDENDPFGIKSVGGGVVVLLVICGFLFIFAKLGEKGSDWIGENVNSVFNDGDSEQKDPAEEEAAEVQEPAKKAEALAKGKEPAKTPSKSAAPQPVKPAPVTEGLSKTESAKVQLIEQLGGPKKVEIRHIAFSKNEEAMVVSLRLLGGDSSKVEEVYFSQDDFNRYIPEPGSVISEDIKIWQNQ